MSISVNLSNYGATYPCHLKLKGVGIVNKRHGFIEKEVGYNMCRLKVKTCDEPDDEWGYEITILDTVCTCVSYKMVHLCSCFSSLQTAESPWMTTNAGLSDITQWWSSCTSSMCYHFPLLKQGVLYQDQHECIWMWAWYMLSFIRFFQYIFCHTSYLKAPLYQWSLPSSIKLSWTGYNFCMCSNNVVTLSLRTPCSLNSLYFYFYWS